MANKLMSAEERKDIFYEYDVFVTHPEDIPDTSAVGNISDALESRDIKILFQNNCIGKDWLTKLKYAATKCRWIVFLDTKRSNNKMFASSKLVESLKSILETRKVQTVVILDKKDDVFIHDDLRWVTCIASDDDKYLKETLCNTVSGKFVFLYIGKLQVKSECVLFKSLIMSDGCISNLYNQSLDWSKFTYDQIYDCSDQSQDHM